MSYIQLVQGDEQNSAGIVVGSHRFSWWYIITVMLLLLLLAMVLQWFGVLHNARLANANAAVSGTSRRFVAAITPTPEQGQGQGQK